MIINPEIHVARLLSVEHATGAVAGSFGAGTPETPVATAGGSLNRVRCAI